MVNKIVEAERAPKQERIVKGLNDVETNISAYGRLKTSLDTMKDMMYDFRRNNTFAARSSVSDNPETVSASADHQAVTGVYSIDVQQLAQSHKLVSDGLNPKAKFGEGQLVLSWVDAVRPLILNKAKVLCWILSAPLTAILPIQA